MSEWKEITLGKVAKVQTGPFGSQLHERDYVKTGTPIITVEHLINDKIAHMPNIPKVSNEDKVRLIKYTLQEGDIVFSRVGAVDRCGYVSRKETGWMFSGRLLRVRPNEKSAFPKYLYFFLAQKNVKEFIKRIAVGTTMPSLNTSLLSDLPIKLPKMETQKSVAAILSAFDDKIDLLRRQNETLEQIAQTLFHRWFVEFEFPTATGAPYKRSGGPLTPSPLGEIPTGWRVSKIGNEVDTLGGGTPSTKESTYWEDGAIYWYSPTDLTKNESLFSLGSEKKITSLGLQKSSAKIFPAYSLLMTSRATVGKITINVSEACTNQGFISIIPNEYFSVYFLHSWLKMQLRHIHNLASGSTFPEINKTDFRNIEIIIPSHEIMANYRYLVQPMYKKIENNIQQNQTLTRLRDTLLPKLMSGQIRVTGAGQP